MKKVRGGFAWHGTRGLRLTWYEEASQSGTSCSPSVAGPRGHETSEQERASRRSGAGQRRDSSGRWGDKITHHSGYPPGGEKPEAASHHRTGRSPKRVHPDDGPLAGEHQSAVRNIIETRGHFPNEEAMTLIWLALRQSPRTQESSHSRGPHADLVPSEAKRSLLKRNSGGFAPANPPRASLAGAPLPRSAPPTRSLLLARFMTTGSSGAR